MLKNEEFCTKTDEFCRPRLLGVLIPRQSGAILMAYLPCLHGGQAIAETLPGLNHPSGRLPFTYPRFSGPSGRLPFTYPRFSGDLTAYYHKPWNFSFDGGGNGGPG